MQSRLVIAGFFLLHGCNTTCTGPGCEDAYTNGGVDLVLGGTDLFGSTILDPTSPNWIGDDAQGTNWSVAASEGFVWIGQPNLSRVIRVPSTSDGALPASPPEWTGTTSFGAAIAVADLDANGVMDLIVGDPDFDLGAGGVFVFMDAAASSGTTDFTTATRKIVGSSPADALGGNIAICGDMSGDNLPEVAFGAPSFGAGSPPLDTVPTLAGVVFVLDSTLWATALPQPELTDVGTAYWGELSGDGAATAVHCKGDVTGDRVPDLIVGAPWHNDATGAEDIASGRVYVVAPEITSTTRVLPPSQGLIDAAAFVLNPPSDGEWFGAALVTLDLDGEQPLELAVGAPGYNLGAGRVHVFEGQELQAGLGKTLVVIRNATDAPNHFGRTLGQGDLDGDGRPDLVVGAPDWQDGGNGYDTGRVWMWSGAASQTWGPQLTVPSASWEGSGGAPFHRVGRGLQIADTNDDGIDDLLLPTATQPQ